MFEFKMPSLGADMVEGTLTSWNVKVGDAIKRGEIICEVETNKGAIDVEVWESGVVSELLAKPGDVLPVGQVIARLNEDEGTTEKPPEKTIETPVDQPSSPVPPPSPAPEPAPVPPPAPVSPPAPVPPPAISVPIVVFKTDTSVAAGERPLVSPAARRLAEQRGVSLQGLKGTGVDGAICLADVENAHREHVPRISPVAKKMADEHHLDVGKIQGHGAHGAIEKSDVEAALRTAPAQTESDPSARMREAIAAAMARSKREIPHYYLEESIPMNKALDWLESYNAAQPVAGRLLLAVLLIKAVAKAAADVPEINGQFVDGRFVPSRPVHVGFAISLRQGGVIPPAIFDADSRDLPALMADLKDLVARVRRGKLKASEMTDGTLTITSLGDLGVEKVFGVIYPPQVAIVGFGRVTHQPVAEGDAIAVRPVMVATLSGDHRVSDGISGAKFLAKVRDYLQNPEQL